MVVKIKKVKCRKIRVVKWKVKFKDYENCLEANQLESERNRLKNKWHWSRKPKRKSWITYKNKRLVLKSQQRFQKTELSANHEKRKHKINSMKTYAYGTSRDTLDKTEETKCSPI